MGFSIYGDGIEEKQIYRKYKEKSSNCLARCSWWLHSSTFGNLNVHIKSYLFLTIINNGNFLELEHSFYLNQSVPSICFKKCVCKGSSQQQKS